MKNKRLGQFVAFLLGVLTATAVCAVPVSANSGPSSWEGVDATGAFLSDGDCPLVVEHETLRFEISDFPDTYYPDAQEFLAYASSVSAEYTFYNPTDMTVTARLLFPYGQRPTYGASGYDPETGENTEHVDLSKYGVQVNGQAVQTAVRHSFRAGSYDFDPIGSFAKIREGYVEDAFFSRELPVYVYTYRVTDLDDLTYKAARASAYFDHDASKTRVMIESVNGGKSDGQGVRVACSVDNGDELVLYVMGRDLGEIEWIFYENGGLDKEIAGRAELVSRTQTTFEAFAMQEYTADSGVQAHDWYNAVVDCLAYSRWDSHGLYTEAHMINRIGEYLLEWYEYEITLAPGERLINTVTAPMYPHIEGKYDPMLYNYAYLLSPASLWADFGTLDIYIDTPYFIVDQGREQSSFAPQAWVKTESGYEMHLDGLPEGELRFTLCQSEDPVKETSAWDVLGYMLMAGIALVAACAAVVVLVLAIVLAIVLLFALLTAGSWSLLGVAVLIVIILAVILVIVALLSMLFST